MRFNETDILARILYQDEAMLVINKPYGIAVHAGPKGGVTLDAFLPALRFGKPDNPQLAHRLDRETTGCLVLGRDKIALKHLGAHFASGRIEKSYRAIVCGIPKDDAGLIDLPLARRSHDKRSWWMKVDPAGDAAQTRYRVLARTDGLAFLELEPLTGRTHQLRVHCSAMGFPIAGDRVYGGERAMAASSALMLHAAQIMVPQASRYRGQELPPVIVEAPLPASMCDFLEDLGMKSSSDEQNLFLAGVGA